MVVRVWRWVLGLVEGVGVNCGKSVVMVPVGAIWPGFSTRLGGCEGRL